MKYAEDGSLPVLMKEILDTYQGKELADAKTYQWRAIFTESSLGRNEVAGKCKKVDGAVSYLTHIDFIILIQKQAFNAATAIDKTRILVHELRHIAASEEGDPQVRAHGGDFCEIAEHDKLSYKIAGEIYRDLKHLEHFSKQVEIVAG